MRAWAVPLAVVLMVPLAANCGSSATGVAACKEIEEARCRAAANCTNVDLTPPYYTSGTAADACVREYDVACLHGLAVSAVSQGQVDACAHAISTKGCAVVAQPWSNVSCAWLTPPPDAGAPEAEAGSDAADASDSADTGSDGTSD